MTAWPEPVPMTDPQAIAARLSGVQKRAVLAPHWSARHNMGLVGLGLCYWGKGPHGKPTLKFRPLGLAVRSILGESNG